MKDRFLDELMLEKFYEVVKHRGILNSQLISKIVVILQGFNLLHDRVTLLFPVFYVGSAYCQRTGKLERYMKQIWLILYYRRSLKFVHLEILWLNISVITFNSNMFSHFWQRSKQTFLIKPEFQKIDNLVKSIISNKSS